ncbi:hypothetical protein HS088_TW17G00029 [Tripterygium wilfordii]|uniref:VQ domain-containing protein n=1 Tax=Tripterygium wilfordii TaxID=458696 RepID=A0A7J7CEH0_TRIWF|nr:hypothetical protein HS088_TW17G00029 [Tripterygium wilfordii]
MVKKASQASMEISKNEKKQFNGLIKVLKPKVYITDGCNFKRLVQELTGNGSTTSSAPPQIMPSQTIETSIPVIDIEDPQSSTEESVNASFNPFNACNQVIPNEEINVVNNQMNINSTTCDLSSPMQLESLFNDWDLESWLLETEPNSFYTGYASFSQVEQEISVYEYELSGLI